MSMLSRFSFFTENLRAADYETMPASFRPSPGRRRQPLPSRKRNSYLLGAHLLLRFTPAVLSLVFASIGVTFSGIVSRLPRPIGVRSFVSR